MQSTFYVTHLIYGLEIVGYWHPEEKVRELAFGLYFHLVSDTLHLTVESKEHCEMRLADSDYDKEKVKEKYHPREKEYLGHGYWR